MAAIGEIIMWLVLCCATFVDTTQRASEEDGAPSWPVANSVVQNGILSVNRIKFGVLLDKMYARQYRVSEYHRELPQKKTRYVRSSSMENITDITDETESEGRMELESRGSIGLVDYQRSSETRRGDTVGAKVEQGHTGNSDSVLSSGGVSPPTEAALPTNSSVQTTTSSDGSINQEIIEDRMVPSPEGEGAKPEPEGKDFDLGSEPGPEPAPENDEDQAYAEPVPDWATAKQQWQSAWQLHVYSIGIMSAVVALYSFVSILRLSQKRNLLSRAYFMSINMLLLVLGTCRAVYFLVDGYNSNCVFHPVLAYCLLNVAFPCLSSAFSILFLALLQSTDVQLMSAKIQRARYLVVIVAVQFVMSFVIDAVVGMFSSINVLMLVCQVVFVTWSLVLSVGYMYVFQKLFGAALRRQKQLVHLSQVSLTVDGSMTKAPRKQLMLGVAVKVTLVTAVLGVVYAGLQVYAMVVVYGFLAFQPQPWPWWVLQFALRIVELGMCIMMSYVATQPFRYHPTRGKLSCFDVLYLIPCHRLCAAQSTEDSSESSSRFVYVLKAVNPSNTMTSIDGQSAGEEVNVRTCSPTRPVSMLINDNGFLRFRHEDDPHDNITVYDQPANETVRSFPDKSRRYSGGMGDILEAGEKRETSPSLSESNTPVWPAMPDGYDSDRVSKSSAFSLKPPSSINLRDSIENILQMSLHTPDDIGSPAPGCFPGPVSSDEAYQQSHSPEGECGVHNIGVEYHGAEEVTLEMDFPNVLGDRVSFDIDSINGETESNSLATLQGRLV